MKVDSPLWLKLRNEACTECKLCEHAQSVCLIGAGKLNCEVMFVGEAPGYREDEIAKPFAGKSGKLLDRLLAEYNLSRTEVYITNAVHCRPPDNDTPHWKEVQTCRHYLVDEVRGVKPRLIIALGNVACQGLLGVKKFAIGNNRGNTLYMPEEDLNKIPIIPTYHPAAVLRKDYFLSLVLDDFERAMRVLKNGASESTLPKSEAHYYKGVPKSPKDHIVIDLETSSLDMFDPIGDILCAGTSIDDYTGFCTEDLGSIRPFLEDRSLTKVNHNIKYDLKWLIKQGYKIRGPIHCTLYGAHLLDENYPSKGLKELALAKTDMGDYAAKMERVFLLAGKDMRKVPPGIRNRYCAQDADASHRLYIEQVSELDKQGLMPIFKVQMDAHKVITEAELFGFNIDQEKRLKIRDKFIKKIDRLSNELEELSGIVEFNPNSSPQLGQLLFGKLGFAIVKTTPTGKMSTDEFSLLELKKVDKTGTIDKILELRKLSGDYSKYLSPDKELMKGDGKIHCDFKPSGTVTGRWSCKNPNLQQVPRESPIKLMFISSFDGGHIGQIDYSQGELRLLAEYSRDKRLLKIFDEGKYDIHLAIAAQLLKKIPEEVTKEERKSAKTVNFGILYGEGVKKLAGQLGVSFGEAQRFLKDYWAMYPGVSAWVKEMHRLVLEEGEVVSLFKRRRRLMVLDADSYQALESLRQGVNSPVQGALGDLTVLSMVALRKQMRREGMRSKILGQVHDSVVVDLYPGEEVEWAKIAKEVFENPDTSAFGFTFRVPLIAEVGIGKNWKEAYENG